MCLGVQVTGSIEEWPRRGRVKTVIVSSANQSILYLAHVRRPYTHGIFTQQRIEAAWRRRPYIQV